MSAELLGTARGRFRSGTYLAPVAVEYDGGGVYFGGGSSDGVSSAFPAVGAFAEGAPAAVAAESSFRTP